MSFRRHLVGRAWLLLGFLFLAIPSNSMAVPSLTAHEGIAETTVKSVGSTYAGPFLPQWLNPTTLPTSGTDISTTPPLHHVYPWFSTDSSFQPNCFSPVNAQAQFAIFWDELNNRRWQFAYRSLWFGGAIFSCAGNLPAAESAPVAYDPSASKSYIGLLSEAATMRGGSPYDRFFVTGSFNLGATIFNHDASNELEPTTNHPDIPTADVEWYRRRWVSSLGGSENYATMSDALAPQNTSGDLLGPVDVRLTNYRETDLWNYSPAIVRREIGCRSTAFVDNETSGSIGFAYGVRGAVVTDTDTSTTSSVPLIYGYQAFLSLSGGLTQDSKGTGFARNFLNSVCMANSTPTLANFDESLGNGIINDWAGIEIESPQYDSDMVEVRSKVGVMIEDLDPASAGGAPQLIEDGLELDPPEGDRAISIERVASMVTRSNALFERTPVSGAIHSAGETQLVYLRDVLHLVPRTTRPSFDPGKRGDKTVLRPSDKVGVLYFDAGKNALILSLPIVGTNGSTSSLPEDPPVVWVKLKLETSAPALDLDRDVAGYEGSNPYQQIGQLTSAIQDAEATAEYAEPRISVELDPTDSDYLLITADVRFGNIGAESIWWRRAGYGVEYKGRTEWVSLEETGYSTTATPRQFRVNRNDFLNHVGAGGLTGDLFPRNILQVMAVMSGSEQVAGASVWM